MAKIGIDGYELKRKIGVGGMSTVWLARQRSLDRFVAIKVLDESLAADADDVARFEVEARIAASLKHIGIVQVLDAGVSEGVCYIVMEHVDGYTVGDWLRRKERISEIEALDVAECVADALGYAWQRSRLVHCDIKPDNVMVDADGTVKVTDLGLARTLYQMQDHLPENEVMGTPAYISPEQAMGIKNLDLRSDIYSLGAMLYHLVGGRMLFHSESEDEMLDNQVNGTDVDICEHNRDVSGPFCFMLEKMLCKEPHARHASWTAVATDLRRVRDGLMPHGPEPQEDTSTMRRSAKRPHTTTGKSVIRIHHAEFAEHVSQHAIKSKAANQRRLIAVAATGVCMLAIVAFAASRLLGGGRKDDARSPVSQPGTEEGNARTVVRQPVIHASPSSGADTGETIATSLPSVAPPEPRRDSARARATQDLKRVKQRAEALIAGDQYAEALVLLNEYASRVDDEIGPLIEAEIARVEAFVEELSGQVYADTAADLCRGNIDGACEKLARYRALHESVTPDNDHEAVIRLLEQVCGIESQIRGAFVGEIGTDVTLVMASGNALAGRLGGVEDSSLQLVVADGQVRVVRISELALRERLRRMPREPADAIALYKALEAIQCHNKEYARDFLAQVPQPLKGALVRHAEL